MTAECIELNAAILGAVSTSPHCSHVLSLSATGANLDALLPTFASNVQHTLLVFADINNSCRVWTPYCRLVLAEFTSILSDQQMKQVGFKMGLSLNTIILAGLLPSDKSKLLTLPLQHCKKLWPAGCGLHCRA